jgi:hypothetical protein
MPEATTIKPASHDRREAWVLLALLGLSLVVYLVGVAHDLPYVVQRDEYGIYARNGAQIAATHNLRPSRLNHPASTIFYPTALVYKLWHVTARQGMLFRPDANLLLAYQTEPGPFLLLGRLISALYAVLAVPLVYLLGKQAFGRAVGLVGAWFLAWTPILIAHTQVIRDDSATVFFTALSMLLALRVLREPTLRNHALAGAAIGLAVSTKYYLGLLAGLLIAVDFMVMWRRRQQGPQALLATMRGVALAGLVAVFTFALTTPFFFLDLSAARANLGSELRSTHLGADGLTPLGNLRYYLTEAIPQELTLGRAALMLVGAALCLLRPRRAESLFLLGFAVCYLVAISLISPLHWARWIFPALPVLYLLAGCALDSVMHWLRHTTASAAACHGRRVRGAHPGVFRPARA